MHVFRITAFFFLLFALPQGLSFLHSQPIQDLYEDPKTGQVYTKPAPGRIKINGPVGPLDKTAEPEDNRGGFARVPSNPILEKLTVVGRLQLRGVSGESESSFNNGNRDFNSIDTNVRRARIGWVYEGGSWWGAALSLRVEDMINRPYLVRQTATVRDSAGQDVTVTRDVTIRDSFGGLQEAFFWFGIPFWKTRITVGQFPIPFLREFQMTSANLINVERAFSTQAYPQMDLGGMISFNPLMQLNPKWNQFFAVQLGVFNGKGSGLDGTGRTQVLTNTRNNTQPLLISPLYVWRMQYNVFGGLVREGKDLGWTEGEEIFQKEMKWSLGIAGMQTNEITTGNTINPQIRGMDALPIFLLQTTPSNGFGLGGTNASSNGIVDTSTFSNPNQFNLTNFNRPSFGIVGNTYDTTFTWKGFYLNGAITRFRGSGSRDASMNHLTLGYVIDVFEIHLMPLIRIENVYADFNLNEKKDPFEYIRNYWIGLNLFGDGHLFKAQLFYQIMQDRLAYDAFSREYMDARNNLLIFQMQATFWTGVKNLQVMDSIR